MQTISTKLVHMPHVVPNRMIQPYQSMPFFFFMVAVFQRRSSLNLASGIRQSCFFPFTHVSVYREAAVAPYKIPIFDFDSSMDDLSCIRADNSASNTISLFTSFWAELFIFQHFLDLRASYILYQMEALAERFPCFQPF